jgi:predicted xylose isomerase-like sugar epimerase
MADVNVSLDSSDIPVIIEALEFRHAALRRTASEKREIEQRPLVQQIKLLINTFKSIQS